ncbi:MAG: Hsp70 family protein [Sporichthyaceae bacterium]
MNYRLGIDLGTTYTAAAVLVAGSAPEPVTLGEHAAVIPTVAYLSADGSLHFGEEAEAAAGEHPERVARHFKRRVGDPVPLVLGPDAHIHAHELAAAMITWVAAVVAEQRGEGADAIAVTYPAGWSAHQRDLLRSALAAQGLESVDLVTEPEAAAIGYSYAGLISHPAKLAVFDLGGGTLDVALLATTEAGGFTRLGPPRGIAELGGIDFDDVLLRHLLSAIGETPWAAGGTDDPAVRASLLALRSASVQAKETLSEQESVSLTLTVDGAAQQITITRADFESWITELIAISTRFFTEAVREAGLYTDQLSWVLLTGGSAQVPLVTGALAAALDETVSIVRARDPKAMVAAGAALSVDRTPLPALAGAGAPSPGAFVPGPRGAGDSLDANLLPSLSAQTPEAPALGLPAPGVPAPGVPAAPGVEGPGVDALGLGLMGASEAPGQAGRARPLPAEVPAPDAAAELPARDTAAGVESVVESVVDEPTYEVGPDVLDSLPPAPRPRRTVPGSTRIPGLTDSPGPMVPGSAEAAARAQVRAADAGIVADPLPAPQEHATAPTGAAALPPARHRGPRKRSRPAAVLAALRSAVTPGR